MRSRPSGEYDNNARSPCRLRWSNKVGGAKKSVQAQRLAKLGCLRCSPRSFGILLPLHLFYTLARNSKPDHFLGSNERPIARASRVASAPPEARLLGEAGFLVLGHASPE